MYFEFPDLNKILQRMQKLGVEMPKEIGQELYSQAEEVATDAKDLFVPVDTGALRSTIHVPLESVVTKSDSVSVELVAGGPAGSGDPKYRGGKRAGGKMAIKRGETVGYAEIVHRTHPTKSGYLEKPLRGHEGKMTIRLAAALDRAIKERL